MSESVPPDAIAAQPLGHVDALPAGTLLGEFELQGLLGVGGFGMVYRGYDHSLQRSVAIKEYMPSALVGRATDLQVSAKSSADSQPFQAGLQSFIAEARLLARFDHPSLVKVYRFWEANNTAYMAMPLYSGITLKQARRQMSGPPPEEWLRTVLWSVMEALKVLHGNNTLHRDVSPDNIFLQDVGPPVLLDLGAARRAVLDKGQKHTAVLKVNYAPVEQYADAKDMLEGPWTDLYAVGAVVHGCVCNEPPLPATFRVLRDRMPSFARVAKTAQTHFATTYAEAFVEAIEHALVVEPSERTQSVADFCEEMQLRAPEDLASFDWRRALGDGVTLQEESSDPGLAMQQTVQVTRTQPQTRVDIPATQVMPPAVRSSERTETSDRPPRRRRHASEKVRPPAESRRVLRWVVVAMGGALGLAGVAWQWSPKPVPPPPVHASVATQAPPAHVAASAVAPAPAPAPVVLAASAPTSVRVVPQATAQARPAEGPRTSSVPQSLSARDKPVAIPPKPARHESPGVPTAPAVPAVPLATHVLCADSNVLTRPLCIYRECQKPEFAHLAVCIEDHKRWEKHDKSPQF